MRESGFRTRYGPVGAAAWLRAAIARDGRLFTMREIDLMLGLPGCDSVSSTQQALEIATGRRDRDTGTIWRHDGREGRRSDSDLERHLHTGCKNLCARQADPPGRWSCAARNDRRGSDRTCSAQGRADDHSHMPKVRQPMVKRLARSGAQRWERVLGLLDLSQVSGC